MPPKKKDPLSNKERQRLWRARKRATVQTHTSYLESERERHAERKAQGKIKTIRDMTKKEKEAQRKKWRESQKKHRSADADTEFERLTPPMSPTVAVEQPALVQIENQQQGSANRGRQKVRRDRAKAYKTIAKLKVKLNHANKRVKKVQKRLERARETVQLEKFTGSPRSKANRLLKLRDEKTLRKHLTFCFTISDALKQKYHALNSQKEKRVVKRIAGTNFLMKYRLLKHAATALRIERNVLKSNMLVRKRRRDRRSDEIIESVRGFYLRDDVSTMRPGKKDYVTVRNVDHQKRVLNDSMTNLHLKYVCENPTKKVGYDFFCRQRPRWVCPAQIRDRETCLCKTHQNLQLMSDVLFRNKVITVRDPELILESLCCSTRNNECMYRECNECNEKRVIFQPFEQTQSVQWEEWRVIEHEFKNKTTGDVETTRRTGKVKIDGDIGELTDRYEAAITRKLARHTYNIRHQYREIRMKKLSLAENEILVHCDFSENYTLKYAEEIQSCHFGGSNQQATLHTGMCYLKGEEFGFATVSGCRRHDPAAIWAHLKPILNKVLQEHPHVDTAYFLSDGPTTQYRCKANFYLMSTLPHDWGMTGGVNWSFLEAGHGKGAADGIGGAIKRKADRIVAQGKDIPDVITLVEVLMSENTSIYIHHITDDDVIKVDDFLNAALPLRTLPGTMTFHQLISLQRGQLLSRRLSCFCQGLHCGCFKLVKHVFLQAENRNLQTRPTGGESIPSTEQINQEPAPARVGSLHSKHAADPKIVSSMQAIHEFSNDLVGKFCVIQYDGKPYPGVIEDVDDDSLRIDAMSHVGRRGTNRFFWPKIKDNYVWYEESDIVTVIPEPTRIEGSEEHFKIDGVIWEAVTKALDEWVR